MIHINIGSNLDENNNIIAIHNHYLKKENLNGGTLINKTPIKKIIMK